MRSRLRLSSRSRSEPSRVRSWVLEARKTWPPALAQGSTVVVEAAGVGRGCVAVGYPLVECAMDDGNGLGHTAVSAKHTFASQSKLRHVAAGLGPADDAEWQESQSSSTAEWIVSR